MRRASSCGQRKAEAEFLLQRRGARARASPRPARRSAVDHRDHLALARRIEVHARKHRAQRQQGRGIELGAVVHVEGGGAAGREALLDQRVEFLRQQVERHVAAVEGIDQDQVVGLLAAVEEHAAVAFEVAHARRLASCRNISSPPSITPGSISTVSIVGVGHEAAEIARDRAAAEADHQHSLRLRRIDAAPTVITCV